MAQPTQDQIASVVADDRKDVEWHALTPQERFAVLRSLDQS